MRRYLGRNSLRCDLVHYCNDRMSPGGLWLYAAKLASFHRCNTPCQASPFAGVERIIIIRRLGGKGGLRQ